MDTCIVCLESTADIFSRISTQSSEWKDGQIKRIIEKHLWWWYLRKPPYGSCQWICRQCWQEICTFHKFYLKVENSHRKYDALMIPAVLKSDGEYTNNAELAEVKEEVKFFNIKCILEEDEIPLAKYRKCKKTTQTELNQPNIANIKSEVDLFDHLEMPKEEYIEVEPSIDSLDDIWEPSDIDSLNEEENGIATDDEDITKRRTSNDSIEDIWKPKGKIRRRKSKLLKDESHKPKSKRTVQKKQVETEMDKINQKNDEILAENKFKFICDLCNVEHTKFKHLRTHYRKEHKRSGYAMCCKRKFFNSALLVDHINVHNDPNYFRCQYCHKVLSSQSSLENHLDLHQQHTNSVERKLTCETCNKSYSKKSVYDRHLLTHVPEEEKQFKCSDCDKKYATEELRTKHIKLAHLKKYCKVCDICGKFLRNELLFKRHIDEHNGISVKIPCDICGSLLANKYRLNRHKKYKHTEESYQPQICPYCSKVSPNMVAHKEHIYEMHVESGKHNCQLCDKKFKRPKHLKLHLSTAHTGEPLNSNQEFQM